MIALIQRVSQAKVVVSEQTIAQISHGLLAFIAIEANDTQATADTLLHRLLHYRIFEDQQGKMNVSLSQTQGGLLLVPQFTLAADTRKGLRPSFSHGADPALGKALFHYLCQQAKQTDIPTAFGEFAADMQVSLVNEGPATFYLQSH